MPTPHILFNQTLMADWALYAGQQMQTLRSSERDSSDWLEAIAELRRGSLIMLKYILRHPVVDELTTSDVTSHTALSILPYFSIQLGGRHVYIAFDLSTAASIWKVWVDEAHNSRTAIWASDSYEMPRLSDLTAADRIRDRVYANTVLGNTEPTPAGPPPLNTERMEELADWFECSMNDCREDEEYEPAPSATRSMVAEFLSLLFAGTSLSHIEPTDVVSTRFGCVLKNTVRLSNNRQIRLDFDFSTDDNNWRIRTIGSLEPYDSDYLDMSDMYQDPSPYGRAVIASLGVANIPVQTQPAPIQVDASASRDAVYRLDMAG